MKISYDQATDSLYIHLSDRTSVESDEVQDGVVLDVDANGALVGIDLQHASQPARGHPQPVRVPTAAGSSGSGIEEYEDAA